MIEKRRLGSTDIEVTSLSMGCAPLGSVGGRLSEDEAGAIVEAAWDAGVRYFDTAPMYGHGLSEKRVGPILARKPRDEFVLSTKVGRLLVPLGEGQRDDLMHDTEPTAIRYDYSYDAARRSLESSFERLGLDRVDILLCHDIDVWTHGDAQPGIYEAATKGVLPALNDLREQGVVRAFGLGVNESAVCAEVMKHFDVDCFLLAGRFTLLEQEPLDSLLPGCVERDVSLIIGGPYNSGLLTPIERKRATYDYKPVDDDRWNTAQAIRRICDAHGVDVRAAALQYPLRHPAVAAVIPGMWRLREVQENVGFMAVDIPEGLWSDLAQAGLARAIPS